LPKPVVLIVEDEPLLRLNAVSMIEAGGFDTLEARSTDEAIALLETDSRIRIVFADIYLPGSMDGLRLAAVVRERWPPVELVLTSGHVEVSADDLPDRGLFLSKPYSAGQLVNALQSFIR
jgi:CheY-like chemotaxis protein